MSTQQTQPIAANQGSRQRLLSAFAGKGVDRPPVWVMRQAGRYLPEYRELKAQHGFLKMVKTPELACEVTLQPLQRFGALDAAIVFSDILIIAEALGCPYGFKEAGGIAMHRTLESEADIAALAPLATAAHMQESLAYLSGAHTLLKQTLAGGQALLGFAAAPFTLAGYMVDGGASAGFPKLKHLYYTQPAAYTQLMQHLSSAIAATLILQLEAGADAVQLFDSWAALAPGTDYHAMSTQWMGHIIAEVAQAGHPGKVIAYAKGAGQSAESFYSMGAQCVGADWHTNLSSITVPTGRSLQGNLDPTVLTLAPEAVQQATQTMLASAPAGGKQGYIANVGHGVTPATRIESMEAFLATLVACA